MDILNSASLGALLEKCSDNTGYRGMVVFNTQKELVEFIEEFVRLNKQSKIPNVRIIKEDYQSGVAGVVEITNDSVIYIEFTNSSIIYLVQATMSARGRRCNTILFDDAIDDETKHILSSMIIPYQLADWGGGDNNKWVRRFMGKWVPYDKPFVVDPMDDVTDTAELDNFLNEFAVKS